MISEKLCKAINDQINAEFWSAYLYLSMSAYCADNKCPGAANWYYAQFQEEQAHAMKFFRYLQSRGAVVELKPITEVPTSWTSLLATFEDTLKHERVVTDLNNNIYKIALDDNDVATQSMLKWFIDEQVEEEETAQEKIDALSLIGDNGYGIYMFDKELQSRVYVPETTDGE